MKSTTELSYEIIGAAIEVHKILGPGLLESAYERCFAYELTQKDLKFQRQYQLPINYKGILLDCEYRLDFLVEDTAIVELKSIEKMLPIHEAQLLTYLKLSKKSLGLLINFNIHCLKEGVKRLVL